jgi:hypothetical protein
MAQYFVVARSSWGENRLLRIWPNRRSVYVAVLAEGLDLHHSYHADGKLSKKFNEKYARLGQGLPETS